MKTFSKLLKLVDNALKKKPHAEKNNGKIFKLSIMCLEKQNIVM